MTTQPTLGRRALESAQYRFGKWVSPVLRTPSRLWYGNDARWGDNRRGAEDVARTRRILGARAPRARDPRSDALRRDGYVLLPSAYPRVLVETIRRKVETVMDDPSTSYPIAPGGASTRVLGLLTHVPDAAALLSAEVRAILEGYYGTFFRVWSVTCWRNRHVAGYDGREEIYSNFWHCDVAPVSLMKLFVNVTDVTAETGGALRLHSRGSTQEIMRSGYVSRWLVRGRAARLLDDPSRVIPVTGPGGSAVLCNTELCLHRASVPEPGAYRDIIEFKFEPSAEPLADDWWTVVAPDVTEQRELGRRATVTAR